MIALALMLAAQTSPNTTLAQRQRVETDFCTMMTSMVREMAAELPRVVDPVTRLVGLSVECSTRTVTWDKRVTVNISQLSADWREVEQQESSRIICDNGRLEMMVERGWRFTNQWTFPGGERVTIDARC